MLLCSSCAPIMVFPPLARLIANFRPCAAPLLAKPAARESKSYSSVPNPLPYLKLHHWSLCKNLVLRQQIYVFAQTEEIGPTFLGVGVALESDNVCSSHSVWLMMWAVPVPSVFERPRTSCSKGRSNENLSGQVILPQHSGIVSIKIVSGFSTCNNNRTVAILSKKCYHYKCTSNEELHEIMETLQIHLYETPWH